MNRSQFTFYESFSSALRRIRRKADRCDAYDAIVDYALYGTEPDMQKLSPPAAIAFDLIRPHLDASRRKALAGTKGSPYKDTEKIDERYGKDPANKKEKENEYKNKFEYKYETERERQARLDRMQREQTVTHDTVAELTAFLESMTGPKH